MIEEDCETHELYKKRKKFDNIYSSGNELMDTSYFNNN